VDVRREFCIGEREVGRLYNVTIYARIMRTERQRGDIDRGDRTTCFALRSGEREGPQLDPYVAQQALDGDSECLVAVAAIIERFYSSL
jgi:hypothetical protein